MFFRKLFLARFILYREFNVSTSHCYPNKNVNLYTCRTHTCGELTKQDVGKKVTLYGWIKYTRFNNKIIALRDSYGTTQCIIKDGKKLKLHNESVVKVSGTVEKRLPDQENHVTPTGSIEVRAEEIEIISQADTLLPILCREAQVSSDETRLTYRYLDIRNDDMQTALRFRSKLCNIVRSRLLDLDFIECETPTLSNRTPGGANEFIVPTRLNNKFYSLTQSPQQLKQMLMIGGLDRYFQIARCYRDESIRSDRQPEFTQIDIELSITTCNGVMDLVDDLMRQISKGFSDNVKTEKMYPFDREIKRITFNKAMDLYGTDKPDLRSEGEDFSPLWVVDFPLFELDKDGNLKSCHHPFTAPTDSTRHFLSSDPLKVKGQHYDLVINGFEVAGGSMRIHDPRLQKQIFQLLRIDSEKFDYFLKALNSGCPTHGGIAFGLDRLCAVLLGKETIKDVIAFPKSTSGRDLMTSSPEDLEEPVKKLYNIKSITPKAGTDIVAKKE